MRQRRETCWYLDKEYVMLTNASELEIFEEAMSDEQSKDQYCAMQDEMDSLLEMYAVNKELETSQYEEQQVMTVVNQYVQNTQDKDNLNKDQVQDRGRERKRRGP